jgi:hypothetical protein
VERGRGCRDRPEIGANGYARARAIDQAWGMDGTIDAVHFSAEALMVGMPLIRESPTDAGLVELLVRRPGPGLREVVPAADLDPVVGFVGDTWLERGSRDTVDGRAHPGMQLTLMNSRVAQLVSGNPDRWSLAGDQVYVDLDLGEANLPAGTRLAVGDAMVEVSGEPHTGCKKFTARFGREALRFVNSVEGRALRLRGMNAAVVQAGTVRVGDTVRRLG